MKHKDTINLISDCIKLREGKKEFLEIYVNANPNLIDGRNGLLKKYPGKIIVILEP